MEKRSRTCSANVKTGLKGVLAGYFHNVKVLGAPSKLHIINAELDFTLQVSDTTKSELYEGLVLDQLVTTPFPRDLVRSSEI